MADQIDLLKQLQAFDGELYRLRKQQREKPRELEAATARVTEQEARLKAASDALSVQQLAQKEKEMELQSREAGMKKLQGQLFQVKTNKAYSAMQHEIDALKADQSLLEETILKQFDAIEQATQARQQEQRRLADEQQRLGVERARIEKEIAAIDEQLAYLERQRTALAPSLPPLTLEAYERILKLREGLAMVPVLNESCGGCHRRLPPQIVSEVYLRADLVMCQSCNRILYHDAHSAV